MVTWELKYDLIHVKEKIATVTGIATDSENPDNPITVTGIALLADGDGEQKAMDGLWEKYKDVVAKQVTIDACLEGLKESGETNLNERKI